MLFNNCHELKVKILVVMWLEGTLHEKRPEIPAYPVCPRVRRDSPLLLQKNNGTTWGIPQTQKPKCCYRKFMVAVHGSHHRSPTLNACGHSLVSLWCTQLSPKSVSWSILHLKAISVFSYLPWVHSFSRPWSKNSLTLTKNQAQIYTLDKISLLFRSSDHFAVLADSSPGILTDECHLLSDL